MGLKGMGTEFGTEVVGAGLGTVSLPLMLQEVAQHRGNSRYRSQRVFQLRLSSPKSTLLVY